MSRRAKRASATTVKIEFGRGCGRSAGFYKRGERRADPEAEREAQREEMKEARRRERAERAREAEASERAREREERAREQRQEHGDKGGGASGQHSSPPPPPRGASTGPRGRREELEPMRARTWAEYDAAFEAFHERASIERSFRVASIPLPPVGHAPVAPAATPEAWHTAVKRASLRWHPDKWARLGAMLADEGERDALKRLTEAMFRAVTRHKERGFRNARATAPGA